MSQKDLPSPNATNFQNRVREEIHRLMGKFGANDRALTLRDALDTGLLVPGPGGLVPGGPGGEPVYVPDLTPPPQPDGFAVDAAISHIFIEHAAPTYTQGHGHMRTVVYGAQVSPALPNPVFNDAVEIAQFTGTVFAYPTNPATTWRLWIKWQSNDGVLSATPAGGTNGLEATTGEDVAALLEALAGQITESELATSLSTPIGQIPSLSSGLEQEVLDRAAAVQVESTTRATQTGELYAQYTVKTDVGGLISGYGLASTANNAAPTSAFGIQAGQFFVAPPTVNQATAPTANLYKGFVWRNSTTGLVQYWTGSAWSTTPQSLPFVVQTTPQVINGFTVEPGIYGEAAFFARLVANRGQIGILAVDDARIANLSAAKLTAGSIAVGQHIESTGYVAGSAGWRINGDGTAEFSGVVVRGTVYATAGLIGGITIASNAVRAGQTAYNTGSGFHLGSDGRLSLGNSAGNRLTFNGTDIEVETPNFSLSNGSARLSGQVVAGGVELGADVGPATGHHGLSLSGDNYNDIFFKRHDGVRFFRVNSGGTNYIDFESSSGNLNIKSAGFSVINGTMTVNQANVINTLNLANNSVSVSNATSTASGILLTTSITIPPNVTARISTIGYKALKAGISSAAYGTMALALTNATTQSQVIYTVQLPSVGEAPEFGSPSATMQNTVTITTGSSSLVVTATLSYGPDSFDYYSNMNLFLQGSWK